MYFQYFIFYALVHYLYSIGTEACIRRIPDSLPTTTNAPSTTTTTGYTSPFECTAEETTNQPCFNAGICQKTTIYIRGTEYIKFYCLCPEGFIGQKCELLLRDPDLEYSVFSASTKSIIMIIAILILVTLVIAFVIVCYIQYRREGSMNTTKGKTTKAVESLVLKTIRVTPIAAPGLDLTTRNNEHTDWEFVLVEQCKNLDDLNNELPPSPAKTAFTTKF